jgi:phosphoglycolate phosphatase/AHBA synthesis associated protein
MRAVLFDLDGVLVDTYEAWFALTHAAARDLGGREVTRGEFAERWGQSVADDAARWFGNMPASYLERYYDAHFSEHAHHVRTNPDVKQVFDAIRAKHLRTAVVTNTPRLLAESILDNAKIPAHIVVGGTDVPNAKPAPDIVWRALQLLAVPPTQAIVVGDTRFDKEAAHAAGVRFVGLGIEGDPTLTTLLDLLSVITPSGK